mmetsp:Transcript_8054/g.18689  ORF Transcript_8054/g.18689 Transcript_8054/m.18689 type:complete len:274 (-) Transcript_8054:99-920(-)
MMGVLPARTYSTARISFFFLFSGKHVAHQLFGEITKLVVILTGELPDCLLGDVTELIVCGSFFPKEILHPFLSSRFNLLGDVTKLVVALPRELGHTVSNPAVDFLAQIPKLIFVLSAELGHLILDSSVNLDGQIAGLVIVLAGKITRQLLADLIEGHRQITEFVFLLVSEARHFILDAFVQFLANVANLVIIGSDELPSVLFDILHNRNTHQFGKFHGKTGPFIIRNEISNLCFLIAVLGSFRGGRGCGLLLDGPLGGLQRTNGPECGISSMI